MVIVVCSLTLMGPSRVVSIAYAYASAREIIKLVGCVEVLRRGWEMMYEPSGAGLRLCCAFVCWEVRERVEDR